MSPTNDKEALRKQTNVDPADYQLSGKAPVSSPSCGRVCSGLVSEQNPRSKEEKRKDYASQ
eukprot:1137232-Pelagomonas_calceolata.AAC.1